MLFTNETERQEIHALLVKKEAKAEKAFISADLILDVARAYVA